MENGNADEEGEGDGDRDEVVWLSMRQIILLIIYS